MNIRLMHMERALRSQADEAIARRIAAFSPDVQGVRREHLERAIRSQENESFERRLAEYKQRIGA